MLMVKNVINETYIEVENDMGNREETKYHRKCHYCPFSWGKLRVW